MKSVLIVGCGGVGAELAKNLCFSEEIASITLLDNGLVELGDLTRNYLLRHNDVGVKTRGEASAAALSASSAGIGAAVQWASGRVGSAVNVTHFDVVVVTEAPPRHVIHLNNVCRAVVVESSASGGGKDASDAEPAAPADGRTPSLPHNVDRVWRPHGAASTTETAAASSMQARARAKKRNMPASSAAAQQLPATRMRFLIATARGAWGRIFVDDGCNGHRPLWQCIVDPDLDAAPARVLHAAWCGLRMFEDLRGHLPEAGSSDQAQAVAALTVEHNALSCVLAQQSAGSAAVAPFASLGAAHERDAAHLARRIAAFACDTPAPVAALVAARAAACVLDASRGCAQQMHYVDREEDVSWCWRSAAPSARPGARLRSAVRELRVAIAGADAAQCEAGKNILLLTRDEEMQDAPSGCLSVVSLPAVLESAGVGGLVSGNHAAVRRSYGAMQSLSLAPALLLRGTRAPASPTASPTRSRRQASRGDSPPAAARAPLLPPREVALATLLHGINASTSSAPERRAYAVEFHQSWPLAAAQGAPESGAALWGGADVVLTSLRADAARPTSALSSAERALSAQLTQLVAQARSVVQEECEEHGFIVLDALDRGNAAWEGHSVLRHCTRVMRGTKGIRTTSPLLPTTTDALPLRDSVERTAARSVILASATGALLCLHLLRRLGGAAPALRSEVQVTLCSTAHARTPIDVRSANAPPAVGHFSHPAPLGPGRGCGVHAATEGFTHWDRFKLTKLDPLCTLREWVTHLHAHFGAHGARLRRVCASRGRGGAVLFDVGHKLEGGHRVFAETVRGCRTLVLELELESGDALISPHLMVDDGRTRGDS